MKNKTSEKAFFRAIKTVGSIRALAEKIGCEQARVAMWKHRKRIPAEYVIPIEKASGVSRKLLRPDIYPDEVDE